MHNAILFWSYCCRKYVQLLQRHDKRTNNRKSHDSWRWVGLVRQDRSGKGRDFILIWKRWAVLFIFIFLLEVVFSKCWLILIWSIRWGRIVRFRLGRLVLGCPCLGRSQVSASVKCYDGGLILRVLSYCYHGVLYARWVALVKIYISRVRYSETRLVRTPREMKKSMY